MNPATQVFFWCRGQDDNIGDAILRRRALRSLRTLGPVDLFVGGASSSFLSAMGIETTDRLEVSRVRWLLRLYAAGLRGDALLAFNPGEVRPDRKAAMAHLSLIPYQLIGRLTGARSARLGVAIRGSGRLAMLPIRFSIRLTSLNTWRDTETARRLPAGRASCDWAFDEGPGPDGATGPRGVLAISYRGDRPPLSDRVVETLRLLSARTHLEPAVFVQARRDNEAARSLASRLGCTLLPWQDGDSHAEQEAQVRELLSRSRIVVSDRIHALIVGVSEGAVPVAILDRPDQKIDRHMAPAGLGGRVLEIQDGEDPERLVDRIVALVDQTDLKAVRERAAAELAEVTGQLRTVCFG